MELTNIVLGIVIFLIVAYLYHVNQAMARIPEEASRLSEKLFTKADILDAVERVKNPPDVISFLPPKQNRRYIVAGGSGLVGGYIVKLLLLRGEDPKAIRIVDVWPPKQNYLEGKDIDFKFGDVTDPKSLQLAFEAPWSSQLKDTPLTVFSTVATIRYWERSLDQLPLSAKINVEGTKNVIAAAKAAKADVFIWTSSSSAAIRNINYWILPWTSQPDNFVQVHNDKPGSFALSDFDKHPNNYCYTKAVAEKIVQESDDPISGFRTGCIRPANVVYGDGDLSLTAQLQLGSIPSWYHSCLTPHVSVENVSLAHLFYEQRLIEKTSKIDLGGQVFFAGDPNPPIAYKDMYLILETLTDGKIQHPSVPPVMMLITAHIVEGYELIRRRYLSILPRVGGNMLFCQPALFPISLAYFKFDDSRARLPPEEGGLGYRSPWTTLDGMVYTTLAYLETTAGKEKLRTSPFQRALSKMEAIPAKISA